MAAARTAEADRHLVADDPAATVDEDGWLSGQTRLVLLASVGRRVPDAEPVWGDLAAACGAVGASGVAEARVAAKSGRTEAGDGAVSEKSAARAAVPSFGGLVRTRTGLGGPLARVRTETRAGRLRW